MEDVQPARPARSSAPTVPGTKAAPAATVEDERPSIPLDNSRLTWAVDLGDDDVRAMSTFDLWWSLTSGLLSADVRIWRVGRDRWLPAREVPEIAVALRISAHEVPLRPADDEDRSTMDYATSPPRFGLPRAERIARCKEKVEPDVYAKSDEDDELRAALAYASGAPSETPPGVVGEVATPTSSIRAVAMTTGAPRAKRRRLPRWKTVVAAAAVAVLAVPVLAGEGPAGTSRNAAASAPAVNLLGDDLAALKAILVAPPAEPAEPPPAPLPPEPAEPSASPAPLVSRPRLSTPRVKKGAPAVRGQRRTGRQSGR